MRWITFLGCLMAALSLSLPLCVPFAAAGALRRLSLRLMRTKAHAYLCTHAHRVEPHHQSSHRAHTALQMLPPHPVPLAPPPPRSQLKAAVAAASATHHRPEPDPALDLACRRLMEQALAQAQLLQAEAPAGGGAGAAAAATPRSRRRAVAAAGKGLYALVGAMQGVMAADQYMQV